jgi:hypothetical protein
MTSSFKGKETMHDTRYYGGDIINTINRTLECRPLIDRGNLRIWATSDGMRAVLLDLDGHDNGGDLEIHDDGYYRDSLKDGVLVWDDDKDDFTFDAERIKTFLNKYKGFE